MNSDMPTAADYAWAASMDATRDAKALRLEVDRLKQMVAALMDRVSALEAKEQ